MITKLFPWVLSLLLAVVCGYQHLKISRLQLLKEQKKEWLKSRYPLKKDRSERVQELKQKKSSSSSPRSTQVPVKKVAPPTMQERSADTEAEIEERVWERIEEIEQERRYEHRLRVEEHLQERTADWSERFSWTEEQQKAVLDLFLEGMEMKMELREQVRDGTIERSELRDIAQKKKTQFY